MFGGLRPLVQLGCPGGPVRPGGPVHVRPLGGDISKHAVFAPEVRRRTHSTTPCLISPPSGDVSKHAVVDPKHAVP